MKVTTTRIKVRSTRMKTIDSHLRISTLNSDPPFYGLGYFYHTRSSGQYGEVASGLRMDHIVRVEE